MIIDGDGGADQPILELNENVVIFETEDHFSLRVAGMGEVKSIPKDVSEAFWVELREAGWHKPDLTGPEDDED